MGINNIRLSPELVAALYPESLVLVNGTSTIAQPSDNLPFLGKNLRKICFIVHNPETEFLPDNQLGFLSKMLAACHCSLNDIALLNAAGAPLSLQAIKTRLNPEMLFLCGVSPGSLDLPETLQTFALQNIQGVLVLPLPSLSLLSAQTAEAGLLKKKLWICLQKMFGL
jgi:hypothetical protein